MTQSIGLQQRALPPPAPPQAPTSIPKTLISIFSFPFSPPFLSTISISRRTHPCSALRTTHDRHEPSHKLDHLEFSDTDNEDENEELDVNALEQEAKDAVEAYSTSLSRILTIDDEKNDIKQTAKRHKRGRPNVGKSALFNRLVGGNRAIVVDEPGVTRDRLYGRSYWGDREFMVVNTGGVLTLSKSQANVMEDLAITTTVGMDGIPLATREAAVARMPSMIERQVVAAVEESSVIVFVVDGQAGPLAADEEIADWLRRNYSDNCVILAVNKCESPRKGILQAYEFWSLEFEPIQLSAISGTGTGDLLDLLCSGLQKVEKFQLIDTAEIRKRAAVFILIIDAASEVEKEISRRLRTSILNRVVLEAVAFKPPPRTRVGKRGRVYYCTQAAIRPPKFVFFVNDAKLFPQTYRRYMERQLRADAGFSGTPIRLLWRSRRVGKDEGKAQESK
ncbi:GTPase Der [Arachis hypogaea]|nr:GTPase Der [Arachis hypogaea]